MSHSDQEFFENPETWDTFTLTPAVKGKIQQFRVMIPCGVSRILDLGCGNGVVTNILAHDYKMTGIDFSRSGLGFVQVPKICASSADLPLRSGGFDLLLCSELLEHLEDDDLYKTVKEILRLDLEYILVSVPNNENIHLNELKCPVCSTIFNASHHHRAFSRKSLAVLFEGYRIRGSRVGGMFVRNYPLPLLKIKRRWGRRWFQVPKGRTVMCPRCRSTEFPRSSYSPISFFCDGVNKLISRRRPYWLTLLLERESATPEA
ncbi:MAG: class I SAM-dependent methyltransferase [Candidatus Eisenbacteria bacterium]|uniref:Class I SAM-dependent methyltransferase n=1 Tax=Eiseniibacteriota bacterium TaxID=2212470 RepID=A0A948S0G1_UNCEI|nr:class I SAM-dependent methyltransferase [Candidatus Eisenbacteria bacterium]MBU1951135.1 class I SAM-dependent methyltransferase [Candidatus Eisenbacteria bacterium]MBU2693002.1 class I SAM-dependent methyltransferase [Candidatus Eisenbacteria bacterium]